MTCTILNYKKCSKENFLLTLLGVWLTLHFNLHHWLSCNFLGKFFCLAAIQLHKVVIMVWSLDNIHSTKMFNIPKDQFQSNVPNSALFTTRFFIHTNCLQYPLTRTNVTLLRLSHISESFKWIFHAWESNCKKRTLLFYRTSSILYGKSSRKALLYSLTRIQFATRKIVFQVI